MSKKKLPPGITERHARTCGSRDGARCDCTPTYQAQVGRGKSRKTKTFPTSAAAVNWREDVRVARRQGTVRLGATMTLRSAGERVLDQAEKGVLLTRSREPYKPATVRGYREALELRIYPEYGALKLDEIELWHLQELVDELIEQGLDASTIRNTFVPVRVVYRWAVARGRCVVNPTRGLELPAVTGKRERFATAAEAAKLIAALDLDDQALWATAFYAGLRRGELMALRWEDVDLEQNLLHVRGGWDVKEGAIDTKSDAGERTLPIVGPLRKPLLAHQFRTGRRSGLVFGRTADQPFSPPVPGRRAARVWEKAKLAPVTLHECRHTFASLMIAAQAGAGKFNPKVLQDLMGHSSITVTYDRYGHLFPGSQAEAGQLLDTYLEEATNA